MYLRLRLFYPLLFHCWLLQIRKVPSILLSWNSHWQPWPASSEGCSVWLHWGHCPSISQHYRSLFQADLYTDLRYTIKVLFLEFPYIFFFRIPQNLIFLHYHRNNHPENLTILKNCFPLASLLQISFLQGAVVTNRIVTFQQVNQFKTKRKQNTTRVPIMEFWYVPYEG